MSCDKCIQNDCVIVSWFFESRGFCCGLLAFFAGILLQQDWPMEGSTVPLAWETVLKRPCWKQTLSINLTDVDCHWMMWRWITTWDLLRWARMVPLAFPIFLFLSMLCIYDLLYTLSYLFAPLIHIMCSSWSHPLYKWNLSLLKQ